MVPRAPCGTRRSSLGRQQHPGIGQLEKRSNRERRLFDEATRSLTERLWAERGRPPGEPRWPMKPAPCFKGRFPYQQRRTPFCSAPSHDTLHLTYRLTRQVIPAILPFTKEIKLPLKQRGQLLIRGGEDDLPITGNNHLS